MSSRSNGAGAIGILVGGGPAPGINAVIGAATQTALRSGERVVGILEGFRWLMAGPEAIGAHSRELVAADVERVHWRGGSILLTSRANPTRQEGDLERSVAALQALGVDRLVTIGGDDTAFSARAVGDAAGGSIRVVHVPKTIDNDLPLPEGIPTFGFETAREHAASLVAALQDDAETYGRWFFAEVMGRHAGFLSLGAGFAGGAAITLIAEEFPEGRIQLDDVVRLLEGAIVKRLANGRHGGLAVVAEGIAERLDPADLGLLGDDFARDEHGNIKLSEVPLAATLAKAVSGALAARGIKMGILGKEIGYELRSQTPTAFDRDYCRDLGVGAVRTLLAGENGVLITRQGTRCVPVSFADLVDPQTGKTRIRMVDVKSDSFLHARLVQERVQAEDLTDPQKLAAIAAAAGLSPDEARQRYAPIA